MHTIGNRARRRLPLLLLAMVSLSPFPSVHAETPRVLIVHSYHEDQRADVVIR